MNYYNKIFNIPKVDKNDNIIGEIERWQAHKKGILHRGYTVVLIFHDMYVVQHRKHPVFDQILDITISSHQKYINRKLENIEESIYNTLKRECNLEKKDCLNGIDYINKTYYKSKDDFSQYFEHEIDYLYKININKKPETITNYSYGYSYLKKEELQKNNRFYSLLAPWIQMSLKELPL